MNRKGFTLVELLATLAILGIIVTIGGVAISKTIKNTKEKNYQLLVSEIKNAAELYVQEYAFSGTVTYQNPLELKKLLTYGYISTNDGKGGLVNPKTNGKIVGCRVYIDFSSGEVVLEARGGTGVNLSDCPTTDHYAGDFNS